MEKTVIVMPVANEEKTMGDVLKKIMALPYESLFVYLVIDSYSKDRTEEIIRKMEEKYDRIKMIFYKESTGLISCYLHGFMVALKDGAKYVIEMDGGGSHLPSEIPQFIEKLDEGYDCVFGSRFIKGGNIIGHPFYRTMISYTGTILSNLVLGTHLKDMTSGFEAFRNDILKGFDLKKFLSKGHVYHIEMKYYCRNYRIAEVPINYIGSESVFNIHSVSEALKVIFKIKKNEKAIALK
jgi:dolichol-phosphate mannosyltransferase